MSKSLGFTLVELMVVISIIGILSAVGLTVFSGTQKNARDAKRKGDIDEIAKAMELHYGFFKPNLYAGLCQINKTGGSSDFDCNQWFPSGQLPQDPNAGPTVGYCALTPSSPPPAGTSCNNNQTAKYLNGTYSGTNPNPDQQYWVICATLENPAGSTYCRYNQR